MNSYLILYRYGGYLLPWTCNQTVEVNGITISYIDRPGATPTSPVVVFIHGFTSNKLNWFMFFKMLPKEWRLVALDLPGHGLSGFRENAGYSAREMDHMLHEVCVCAPLPPLSLSLSLSLSLCLLSTLVTTNLHLVISQIISGYPSHSCASYS